MTIQLPGVTSGDVDIWLGMAISELEPRLCFNPLATATSVEGVGEPPLPARRLVLPTWASEVTGVTVDGVAWDSWKFEPSVQDLVDGELTSYGSTVELTKPLPESASNVRVEGSFGFTSLPSSLASLLAATLQAVKAQATGEAWVTSKSIEDVSVSMSTPTVVSVVETFAATIQKWSLCPAYRHPTGWIDSSPRMPEYPWWDQPAWIGW